MGIQYEHAPITEALIDVRIESSSSLTLRDLEGLHAQIREYYPKRKSRYHVEGQFSAGAQVGALAKQTQIGFVFVSSDELQLFQARIDGFTFSRLRPYGNWNELRTEARRLWGLYRKAIGDAKIIRTAVRYINQIDIPQSSIDYKDYFRTTPEVSPDLPQGLSGFLMQLQFPLLEVAGTLILTQMAVPPLQPQTSSVILDIDAFKDGVLDSDGDAWALLEKLRDCKNQFFFGSITDKTRGLFGRITTY